MDQELLTTIDSVFEKLGGNSGLEALTGSKPSTVSMWKKSGKFPTKYCDLMIDELHERGFTAPKSLWGMKERAA